MGTRLSVTPMHVIEADDDSLAVVVTADATQTREQGAAHAREMCRVMAEEAPRRRRLLFDASRAPDSFGPETHAMLVDGVRGVGGQGSDGGVAQRLAAPGAQAGRGRCRRDGDVVEPDVGAIVGRRSTFPTFPTFPTFRRQPASAERSAAAFDSARVGMTSPQAGHVRCSTRAS